MGEQIYNFYRIKAIAISSNPNAIALSSLTMGFLMMILIIYWQQTLKLVDYLHFNILKIVLLGVDFYR